MIREVQVTFDSANPAGLAAFWCEVLGYRIQPPPPGFATWEEALDAWGVPADQRDSRSAAVPPEGESGPRLFFQKVPEGKAAKNRVHLDVRAAPGLRGQERLEALRAERDRLVRAGAHELYVLEPTEGSPDDYCIVMQDPEGNEFCLD